MYQNLIITSQSAKQQIIKMVKLAITAQRPKKTPGRTGKQNKSKNNINKLVKKYQKIY